MKNCWVVRGRVSRFRRLPATVAFLAMSLVLAAALPASGWAKAGFRPGVYTGKTSQGYPVKLRLTTHGEPCGGKPCLFAPSDHDEIYIAIPCPAIGQSTNDYMALFGNLVKPSGLVDANQEGFSKLVATLKVSHHGTISGRMRDTETLEDGTKCDSGPLTLTAKLSK